VGEYIGEIAYQRTLVSRTLSIASVPDQLSLTARNLDGDRNKVRLRPGNQHTCYLDTSHA